MNATKNAQEFLQFLLGSICEDPDSLDLQVQEDELGTLFTIQVAEDDMGRLIGRGGQNISAIRTLVRVIGAREGERINIKVLD
jgi:predicted RNA-binding protein YlqC (UPF0109 family)